RGILPDLETQEFKSRFASRRLQRMGDPGFALLQFQSHPFEPFLDDLSTLLDHCSFFVQDHKVIGVAHHFRWAPSPPSWKLFADDPFQPVECNIGQERRNYSPVLRSRPACT